MGRTAWGRGLFNAGAVSLPLGLGAAAGYWVADANVRWIPTTLGALLVLGIAALVMMAVGSHLTADSDRRKQKRIVTFGVLAVFAGLLRIGVWVASTPSPLSSRDASSFAEVLRADVRHVQDLERSLAASSNRIVRSLPEGELLLADEEQTIADAWSAYVDAAFALDQVRRFYEDYYHLDLSRAERQRHTLAFLVTFTAELALFEHTTDLEAAVREHPNVSKFLDLPRPDRHLNPGSYTAACEQLTGVSDFSRVVAGKKYMAYLATAHGVDDDVRAAGHGGLWEDVAARLDRLSRRSAAVGAVEAVWKDVAPIERGVKQFAFPVQKGVAEWMGDTRVKRIGRYLITAEQADAFEASLLPGDILLARKNWYLSNVGLPGFWPHALIYIGDENALAKAFDGDPEVQAWLRSQGHDGPFTTFLAQTYPRAWRERAGHPVIEAVSEGVVQSDLEHAAGDYLAALRPLRSNVTKAVAVQRAFSFLGRPYDFDFDFATDHALVCTEVVWRSYRASSDEPGLDFPVARIAGRLTLPANDIARVFRDEPGRMAFVGFIEGREHHGDAVVSDEVAFRATVDRSKWDFGQP